LNPAAVSRRILLVFYPVYYRKTLCEGEISKDADQGRKKITQPQWDRAG